ncbi:hypothetical protein Tco_0371881 [Tanacetum coccineum]
MLGMTPNQVYDPFLKDGLGYKNPKRLKKAIAAQPKMYHGEMLYNNKLKIDSPDSEETLEDAKESRLKMRNKMVQLNYGKLNALYEHLCVFVSHEKCVARDALSRDSKVKRALFTTPVAAKSKNLGATSVVVKSRLSVAKTPIVKNKVSSALPLSLDSSQSRTLSN